MNNLQYIFYTYIVVPITALQNIKLRFYLYMQK